MIEVISENVEYDMRNDLRDLAVAVARASNVVDVLIADPTAFFHDALRESKHGVHTAVTRRASAGIQDLVPVQTQHLADGGVCRQAVLTPIGLGDRQRDLFGGRTQCQTVTNLSCQGQAPTSNLTVD